MCVYVCVCVRGVCVWCVCAGLCVWVGVCICKFMVLRVSVKINSLFIYFTSSACRATLYLLKNPVFDFVVLAHAMNIGVAAGKPSFADLELVASQTTRMQLIFERLIFDVLFPW